VVRLRLGLVGRLRKGWRLIGDGVLVREAGGGVERDSQRIEVVSVRGYFTGFI
jgi:hypothetical protein